MPSQTCVRKFGTCGKKGGRKGRLQSSSTHNGYPRHFHPHQVFIQPQLERRATATTLHKFVVTHSAKSELQRSLDCFQEAPAPPSPEAVLDMSKRTKCEQDILRGHQSPLVSRKRRSKTFCACRLPRGLPSKMRENNLLSLMDS